MKLVIQIPCYNEENTIVQTIKDLPKSIKGIDVIEILVINDGSEDSTKEKALELGAHVVDIYPNKGLANAFQVGLKKAIELGADIIVNTDGDNQYCASYIEELIQPILDNNAEIVIGARPIFKNDDFSFVKKVFQKLGSFFVRILSGTNVKDAPCGFRAFSRKAASKIKVYNKYSYTIETIFQAKALGLKMKNVDINVNPNTRKSKLFSNIFVYMLRQGFVSIKMFIKYRP